LKLLVFCRGVKREGRLVIPSERTGVHSSLSNDWTELTYKNRAPNLQGRSKDEGHNDVL